MKTKNQSIYTFFETLQLEYMVAYLRSKIYPRYKDKKYYKKRVMEGKREKIEQISARNNLVSIFDDKETFDEFYEKVVPQWGMPKFTYINEAQKEAQYELDRVNYFAEGSDVAVKDDKGNVNVGKIVSNDLLLDGGFLGIRLKGQKDTIRVLVEDTKRIL